MKLKIYRSSSLINEDLAPIPSAKRTWGTWNYAALMDQHESLHSYLYAGKFIDRWRNELVAGNPHYFSW